MDHNVKEAMQKELLLRELKAVEQELCAYYNGEVMIYDYEEYYKDELQEVENKEGIRGYLINDCFVCEDDMEVLSLVDYINDCLEVTTFDMGSYLMITYGGPTIYVNTIMGCIEGSWCDVRVEYPISKELVSAINEAVK